MKITIVGAVAGDVTGSVHYVHTKQTSVLVDCGMFQGGMHAEALAMQIQQPFKLPFRLPGMGNAIEL